MWGLDWEARSHDRQQPHQEIGRFTLAKRRKPRRPTPTRFSIERLFASSSVVGHLALLHIQRQAWHGSGDIISRSEQPAVSRTISLTACSATSPVSATHGSAYGMVTVTYPFTVWAAENTSPLPGLIQPMPVRPPRPSRQRASQRGRRVRPFWGRE